MVCVPKWIMLGVAVSVLPTGAMAQTSPEAGVQLEQQKQLDPTRKPQWTIPDLDEEKSKPKKPLKSDTPITVQAFQLAGNLTVFTEQQIQDVLQPYVGKVLTIRDLFEITDSITAMYRDKGYFLAKAFLPAQDVTDGKIIIRIEEGHRDSSENGVRIIGENLRIDKARIRRIVERAIPADKALLKTDLERAILLMRDLPGITASANLEKGSQRGTTAIVADVKEGAVFNPWGGIDNSGGRLTGEWRLTAGADINDPIGNGEHLNLYAAQSFGSGDMKFFRAAFDHPIGYSGLKAGAAINYLEYEVGKELSASDTEGRATNVSLFSSYPIIRHRETNLLASAVVDFKTLSDSAADVTTNRKKVRALRLGVEANHTDRFLMGGFTSANLKFHAGDLDLKLDSVELSDRSNSGAFTDGSFRKLTFGVRRVQRNHENFFLIADVKGQLAGKNLDTSEKFQLGGPNGVRAYPSGEGLGDHAIKATAEAHYVFSDATRFGDVRLIGFYDWGHIQQYRYRSNIDLDTPNRYSLSGAGLGLNIGRPGELDFNLFWAHRLGNNPGASTTTGLNSDGSGNKNRFWLSLTAHF